MKKLNTILFFVRDEGDLPLLPIPVGLTIVIMAYIMTHFKKE